MLPPFYVNNLIIDITKLLSKNEVKRLFNSYLVYRYWYPLFIKSI